MPLLTSSTTGEQWQWGFKAADAPTIGPGFNPVEGEVRYGPEVYTTSANGEGHVDSVTNSKPEWRKWEASFKGRIDASFDPDTFPNNFDWRGRVFHIKPGGISQAIPKGDYHEVTIETESFAGVKRS